MALLADRYELGDALGAGGMARVVAARDLVLERIVAIKIIHERYGTDPTVRERLLREARTAAGLHHPNTVTVFDVGDADGQPFIVMELVQGYSLAERLENGALTVEESVAIADATLAGLNVAHQRGLVHRDVKPSNILLPFAGGLKLADFGIAKVLAETTSGLTGTGQLLGTPRYLPPEQAMGEKATPASDVYSMGVVLYQCLAGDVPFRAETPIAVALAHQYQPVPSLAAAAPGTPTWLCQVVERALAKNPADRFPDASAVRETLTRGTAPTPPILAAMPGPPSQVLTTTPGPPPPPGHGDDGTRFLEPPGRHQPSSRGVRRWWPAVTALIAAVIVAVVFILTREETDPDETSDPAASETTPASGDGDATEDTENTSEVLSGDLPTELDELIGVLALEAVDAGAKGEDLFDNLREVRAESIGSLQTEAALGLIEEIASWMADGELGTDYGAAAVVALDGVAQPVSGSQVPQARELYVEMATSKPLWGENADTLLSDLRELLLAGDQFLRSTLATEMIEELRDWAVDGEIDRDKAQLINDVLRPLADYS